MTSSRSDKNTFTICATPIVHVVGCLFLLSRIHYGEAVNLPNDFEPAAALYEIERGRGHRIALLPYMFDALANEQEAHPKNVEALQNCVSGGDNLSPRLQQRFEKAFGVKLLNLIARPRRVRASHPGRGRFALAPESKSNSSIGLAERCRAHRAGCYRILGESIVNCPAQ
jgi:acyl-CoA synthetase (AMP-forming)/AMP-acid ligase II